jgi:hypothetical protein
MKSFEKYLKIDRDNIFYLSLFGKKNIILKSTNKPMNLLHVQWSTQRDKNDLYVDVPQKGFTHMFCLPLGDRLNDILQKMKIITDVTASVISFNIDNDFKFILTSEI